MKNIIFLLNADVKSWKNWKFEKTENSKNDPKWYIECPKFFRHHKKMSVLNWILTLDFCEKPLYSQNLIKMKKKIKIKIPGKKKIYSFYKDNIKKL